MKKLEELVVGDLVTRDMVGIETTLAVTAVTDNTIVCGAWTFHRRTGGEIDEDLDWDGQTRYGSRIKPLERTET